MKVAEIASAGRLRFVTLLLCIGSSIPAAAAAEAEVYDLNVILSLTGGASFLGKAEQQSLLLAEKWVNESGGIQGRPLRAARQSSRCKSSGG
jgi:branched-chain amino acid transport system substrate-binding protein